MNKQEKQRIRKNKNSLNQKKRNVKAVVETRWRNKMRLVQYKGGKCEMCGYDKPVAAAYHFHHNKDKKFTISRYMSRSIDRLKKEADRCQLLCANCHAETHDKDYSDRRMTTIKNWQEWDVEEQALRKKREKKRRKCPWCHKDFELNFSTQKFCSPECRISSQRKVQRPSKEKLQKLIKEHSWVSLGRKFGVSDNAIRKWARRYGLIWSRLSKEDPY